MFSMFPILKSREDCTRKVLATVEKQTPSLSKDRGKFFSAGYIFSLLYEDFTAILY